MDNLQEVNRCYICARGCNIPEGGIGKCEKYTRHNGELVETAPARYLVVCPISIETMPLVHYYPKGKFLQITTTGCNFSCPGCVSTMLVKEISQESSALLNRSAEEIIQEAKKQECLGITFVMNDPLASFFTFMDVAKLAKKSGLLVGCSSNGYFTRTSAKMLAPYLDFINIGIKGFSDRDYTLCGAHSIQPVLDTLAIFHEACVHIEVSLTYKKADEKSVQDFSSYLNDAGYNIPLQIMRYIPLEGALPDLEPSIQATERFCRNLRTRQDYVYLFNTPGTDFLHTRCHKCGTLLIERDFYGPMGAKVKKIHLDLSARCPQCGTSIPVEGVEPREAYTEKNFQGGYPFTRALEMIQAILVASGITDLSDVVKVWEKVLSENYLETLHEDIQSIDAYIESITKFAALSEVENNAIQLTRFMQGKVDHIQQRLEEVTTRPRVYYTMSKPLFAIKGGRFENQLVTAAGGISLNKELEGKGRPGHTIDVHTLNQIDPDVIFISSFFSNSTDDYHRECLEKGINVKAVRSKRIYTHPYPNWDFGSPRWILGLMNMANILHPELFQFDMFSEAQALYQTFYAAEFKPELVNLSFAKPSSNWQHTGIHALM